VAKIVIVTTVPETLALILKEQPRYLHSHFDVELVTSPGQWCQRVAEQEGVPVHPLPMTRGISVSADLVSVLRMVRLLQETRPAVLHSYTPKAGLVAMLAGWLCRIPVRTHTFTGLLFPSARGLRRQILIWADRLICACATHVVPEGNGVKRDLQAFGITRKPLHVIGFGNIAGIDTSHFRRDAPGVAEAAAALRAQLGIAEGDFVFCFIGRINRDKGMPELMAAFAALPAHCHLVLAGELDATAAVDAPTVAAMQAHPRVHALGFVHDVRPALLLSDVMVLPSYREGFPNVILQAGAMEVPVIATDINGCNEVIKRGCNGWLVPPHDAAALGEAMAEACRTTAARRQSMGRRARERVCARFERLSHWERMAAFYHGLLTPASERSGRPHTLSGERLP